MKDEEVAAIRALRALQKCREEHGACLLPQV